MGWFDEQIRLRKLNDDQVFAEALQDAAGVVIGRKQHYIRDDRVLTGSALEKILRYYRLHYEAAPETVDTLEGQLEHSLYPQGMMYRKVRLEDDWHKRAIGAYLGFRAEDNAPLALIPSGLAGYRCYDPAAGTSWAVTAGTRDRIKREAYCFYRPLPQKKIGIPSLMRYILSSLYLSDFLIIAAVTLGVTLIGFLTPRLTNLLYGPVLERKNVSVLAAMAIFMICAGVSRIVISTARDLISACVETRVQLNVESAAMMRVLSLPPDFFREYSSGELSSRVQSVNTLCSSLVNAILTTGLTSLISLLYITQIFRYAPVLVVPSLVIILLTVVLSILTMLLSLVFLQATPSVVWKAAVNHVDQDRYQLVVTGEIAPDYYVHPMKEEYVGTQLEVEASDRVVLSGDATEEYKPSEYKGVEVVTGTYVLRQDLEITGTDKVTVDGTVTWSACSGDYCQMPEDYAFSVEIPRQARNDKGAGNGSGAGSLWSLIL